MTNYVLFMDYFVSPLFKKRLCSNRSMRCNASLNDRFKSIANSGCNSFSLVIGMNVESVKKSMAIYISETNDDVFINSYDAVVLLKRLIPFF